MRVLKNIDVFSVAKIFAVIDAIIGLVIGIIAFVFAGSFAALFGTSALQIAGLGAVVIVVIPIALFIIGFVIAVVESWLYNLIGSKVGWIKLDFKKGQIKSIDLMSAGKIWAVGGAIVGAIVGIIVLIFGLVSGSSAVAVIGAVGIIGFAILFAIVFFVAAIIGLFLYNFIASKIGGVILYFKGKEIKSINIIQFAKVEGLLAAIWGLVAGVISAFASLSPAHYSAMHFGHFLGVFAIIVFPIMYGIIGFVAAAVESWLYNLLAPKVGGAKITLV